MNNLVRFVALTLLTLLFPAYVFAADYRCPDTVETTQTLKKSPADWEAFARPNDIQRFERITLYDGVPADMASLVPDDNDKVTLWTFFDLPDRPLWMACEYSNTTVNLVRKLQGSVKECRLKGKNTLSCK